MSFVTLDKNHIYHLGEAIIPGVTEILSTVKYIDLSKIPVPVLEAAQKIGTESHDVTQRNDENRLKMEFVAPEIMPYLLGWQKFLKEYNVTFLQIEQIVYSLTWGYAGKIDRLGVVDGQLTLIDIKTTTTVGWSSYVQVMGGYKTAVEEMLGRKIINTWIIQLLPSGDYAKHKCKTIGEIAKHRSDFLAAVQVVKARIRNKIGMEEMTYEREIFGN